MTAPEPVDAAPVPTICSVQGDVTADCESPHERASEVREKEREPGAREICFGWEAERARRRVGGGKGDVELGFARVKGVKVV